MFIFVVYKDAPELSNFRRSSSDEDLGQEKTLLVNPKCPVRVMLEYIRKQCKLAAQTMFDLCDESGNLLCLFGYPTYAYADMNFEHKKTYYLVVICTSPSSENDTMVFPQVNRDNNARLYIELQQKVKKFILAEMSKEVGSINTGKNSPASKKKT